MEQGEGREKRWSDSVGRECGGQLAALQLRPDDRQSLVPWSWGEEGGGLATARKVELRSSAAPTGRPSGSRAMERGRREKRWSNSAGAAVLVTAVGRQLRCSFDRTIVRVAIHGAGGGGERLWSCCMGGSRLRDRDKPPAAVQLRQDDHQSRLPWSGEKGERGGGARAWEVAVLVTAASSPQRCSSDRASARVACLGARGSGSHAPSSDQTARPSRVAAGRAREGDGGATV